MIVDIVGAIYNKEHKMRTENIYSDIIFKTFGGDWETNSEDDIDLSEEKLERDEHITNDIYKYPILQNKMNKLPPDTYIKETLNKIKIKMFSKKESEESKISFAKETFNKLKKFFDIINNIFYDSEMKKLFKEINELFINNVIDKIMQGDENLSSGLISLITYYNRYVNQPYTFIFSSIPEIAIKYNTEIGMIDKNRYIVGKYDKNRLDMLNGGDYHKYISTIDSYMQIYEVKGIKQADFFFILDIMEYFENFGSSTQKYKDIIDSIIEKIKTFIKLKYDIDYDELNYEVKEVHEKYKKIIEEEEKKKISNMIATSGESGCKTCGK